jgi:uroporphyrinogen decarboxylase
LLSLGFVRKMQAGQSSGHYERNQLSARVSRTFQLRGCSELPMNAFNELVLGSSRRLAMPIAVYPGLAITGARVQDVVSNPEAQFQAQVALQERYQAPWVLSAMDLSAEAEAFGGTLYLAENEIPSVTGHLVTSLEEARKLAVPKPGDKRTSVYLETVRRLRSRFEHKLVLAGCIGPFSLAARLVGVSEAMELTVTEPELMESVLEKSVQFLIAYIRAFRAAGADGVLMADPAAGLLSPRSMSTFSSGWIRRIGTAVEDGRFALILHNCAARVLHLPALLETGRTSFHFGAPMDLAAALSKVPAGVVLCGNLDPTAVFLSATPAEVSARTKELLRSTRGHRNYVISSGCDVPATAPLANLDAFFEAVAEGGSMGDGASSPSGSPPSGAVR